MLLSAKTVIINCSNEVKSNQFFILVTPDVIVMQNCIKETLEEIVCSELHPRSCISVIVQELDVDGRTLASAINSACCALLDASVSMRCLVAAVTVGITKTGTIINPSNEELQENCVADLTFAFDSSSYKKILVRTNGKFKPKDFIVCCRLAKNEAKNIFSFYKASLANSC